MACAIVVRRSATTAAITAATTAAFDCNKGNRLKKVLVGLVVLLLLIASVPLFLLATGAIDSTSLRMILNVVTGLGGTGTSAARVGGVPAVATR